MAFDVSALTDYVDQTSEELLLKSQIEGRTASLVTKQPGIKSSAALQLFDTDVVIQDGAGCGYNTSGTTALSQRIITTGPMKVQEDLCTRDLEAKWTQILLRPGQNYEEDPAVIAAAYMEDKIAKLQAATEVLDWQATTAGTDFYDGFLTIIDAATGPIDGNTQGITVATGITTANVFSIFRDIILATPHAVKRHADFRVFCGQDVFDTLVFGLLELNNFHFSNEGGLADKNYSLTLPGTNTVIEGVGGLSGTDRIIAARGSNLYIGMDMEGEEDEMRVWYSKDDDVMKHSIRWRRGTQVAFPDEIVEFTLVP